MKKELKGHGLSDTEEIYDPKTGEVYNSHVMAGPQYTLKLDKTVDANYSARSVGGYDNIGQPVKGGEEGAKSTGYMEMLGLLGSDARHNLKEIGTIKSEGGKLTNSDEYWDRYVKGQSLPATKKTFATDKFFDMMYASGAKVTHKDGKLSLSPVTDKDILMKSNGQLDNAKMVFGKDLKPEKGGLFDVAITGGVDGQKWSHLALDEPIVNPIMEDPAKNVLGLSDKEFKGITSGKFGVKRVGKGNYNIFDTGSDSLVRNLQVSAANDFVKSASEGELMVAGEAFESMLKDLSPEDEVALMKDNIHTIKSASKKDKAMKRMKHLQGLVNHGHNNVAEAMMLRNIPILPPVMRPVTANDRGVTVADVNSLYKDLHLVSKGVGELKDYVTPDFEDLQKSREDTYGAAKGYYGWRRPCKLQEQESRS